MIQFASYDPHTVDVDQLGDDIAELAAHLHAATYRLLVCLHEFDERGGWYGGFRSCAHWLSWRTGIALGAAREKVRVARALVQLPHLSDTMRRGQLSFAQVRAMTRVATPQNEEQLVDVARHCTAAHIEKIVRAWRRVDRLETEQARHEARFLSLYIDDDGSYVLRGRLDPEVGALLQRAIEAASDALHHRRTEEAIAAATGEETTSCQRRADALALVAECALNSAMTKENSTPQSGAGRYEVVLHVDAEHAVLQHGARVSAETSRRIACDAGRVVMTHDRNGNVLDVGRRTRTVPPAIRRALDHRDRGCRFPGCNARFCDAHHVQHWADGGATRLDNLVLLCRFHHRAVHEGGFTIEFSAAGTVTVTAPNGKPMTDAPTLPALRQDSVVALHAFNTEQGIDIDAWTPTPDWHGERLDLDQVLTALLRHDRHVSAESRDRATPAAGYVLEVV